jgi:hypothetical protein
MKFATLVMHSGTSTQPQPACLGDDAAQYPLHEALNKIRPLLRAVHRNPAADATEIAMRPSKQGILNVTLPVLKLTLSEPRETIFSLIHALWGTLPPSTPFGV